MAPIRKKSPSRSQRLPNLAPQKRTAFSRTTRNTGARSPRDELTTSSTFEVAACCSCSSRSSRLRWSSCWWRAGSGEPSSGLRCGRRLAVGGLFTRVPLRPPSAPPSRFNAAPGAKNGLFSSLLQHGFGELGTGPGTIQRFVQGNKSGPFGVTRLRVHRRVTPPSGGGERSARSVNTRWSMPNSRGRGWHFQYTLSLPYVREQTIAVPAGNPDAVPAYVQNKSQPIHDPT